MRLQFKLCSLKTMYTHNETQIKRFQTCFKSNQLEVKKKSRFSIFQICFNIFLILNQNNLRNGEPSKVYLAISL